MVNTSSMKLIKHVERPIKKDTFLIELELKINSSSLIKEIEEGINSNSNYNYVTHVKGKMTSWDHFVKNQYFLSLVKTGTNYLDEHISLTSCYLRDAWGTKVGYNDRIREHHHYGCIISGVLYLQDSDQELYFRELDISIAPKKGKLILFSPLLRHGTKSSLSKKPRYSIAFNYNEDESQRWK